MPAVFALIIPASPPPPPVYSGYFNEWTMVLLVAIVLGMNFVLRHKIRAAKAPPPRSPAAVLDFLEKRTLAHGTEARRGILWMWLILPFATWGVTEVVARMPAGERPTHVVAALVLLAVFLWLHFEVFYTRINWDEEHLHASSYWRQPRMIPLSKVEACTFSPLMRWYRIHCGKHGVVRVHVRMEDVPYLLAQLPCDTPPYPPGLLGRHRRQFARS